MCLLIKHNLHCGYDFHIAWKIKENFIQKNIHGRDILWTMKTCMFLKIECNFKWIKKKIYENFKNALKSINKAVFDTEKSNDLICVRNFNFLKENCSVLKNM